MGIALKEQDKLEEAIEAYTKVLSIKPRSCRGLLQHGHAISKSQDKLEEAIEAYSKA